MTRSIEDRISKVNENRVGGLDPEWYDKYLESMLASDITVLATLLRNSNSVNLVSFAIDNTFTTEIIFSRGDVDFSPHFLMIPTIGTAEDLAFGIIARDYGIHPAKIRNGEVSASTDKSLKQSMEEYNDNFYIVDEKPLRLIEIKDLFHEMVRKPSQYPALIFLESINPFLPSFSGNYDGWESSLWEAMNILRSIAQELETPILTTFGWPEGTGGYYSAYESNKIAIRKVCCEEADVLATLYSLGNDVSCLYGRYDQKPNGYIPDGDWHFVGKHYFLTQKSGRSASYEDIALSVDLNGFGDPIGELIRYEPDTAIFNIPGDGDFPGS